MALKYGIFSELSLSKYLFIIAGAGMLIYLLCAFIFTMKTKAASEEKSLSKGVLLKRQLQMYTGVYAGYLALVFLLSVTFLINTSIGARLLIIVLGINVLLPFISMSFLNPGKQHQHIGNPSETDRFMQTKGKYHTFSEVRKTQEFWLVNIAFCIIIGVARMMDDNAQVLASRNRDNVGYSQTFQMFEVFGSFTTSVFLSLFRLYVSPHALLTFVAFLLLVSQVLMFFISLSTLALYLAIVMVGFVQGSSYVLVGIITHENYGTKNVARILGTIMTAGAIGILIFDELILDRFYNVFASENDYNNQKSYGKWNKYIFIIAVLSSVIAFITAMGSYLKTRHKESEHDKVKGVINF